MRCARLVSSRRVGSLTSRSVRRFASKKDEEQTPTISLLQEQEHEPTIRKSDQQIINEVLKGELSSTSLENELKDFKRAVSIRRAVIEEKEKLQGNHVGGSSIKQVPWQELDYSLVHGTCCENVIGYIPIPVGLAGPVLVNGVAVPIPMATTEGCLVASTHRGCKAINEGGGAHVYVTAEGMTRGPVVKMPSAGRAVDVKRWLEFPENMFQVATAFNSTSRYARLSALKVNIAGPYVYIRFKSITGDAMGMNMISKGVEKALALLQDHFKDMNVVSVSGNFCTDKKATALNWIDGRGKTVVAECTIPKQVVKKTLKTSVDALVELNIAKNLVGSAMAGAVGGFNAHASNIVTAMFIASGQDPAQNVESSMCINLFEKDANGDLHVSVTMPSIEVGTIGGGTGLPAQSGMLQLMGVKGTADELPGTNARRLASIVATGVLAGELSLNAALSVPGTLVKSHMLLNRKKDTSAPQHGAGAAGAGQQAGQQDKAQANKEDILLKGSLYGSDDLNNKK